MIGPLTPNTQAILLLTAPLIAGHGESSRDQLSLGEYNKLARILREKQLQPADLIGPEAHKVIEVCAPPFGLARLEALLGRGFLLSQMLDRWNARAIWVISRADATYPKRLKTNLKEDAPTILYGCGNPALLDAGGLAVVGSRNVDDELIHFAEDVGRLSANAKRSIISGAAKGIDRAAISGALQAGGAATGVMADSLERAALNRDNREPLMEGRLVLISPYDPSAGFNVGHAMQRNKLIYALADAALVATSDFEKGGTWAGAVEQLNRLHFVPIFVRNGDKVGKGNSALLQQGGQPWPNPRDGEALSMMLASAVKVASGEPKQDTLPFGRNDQPHLHSESERPEKGIAPHVLNQSAPVSEPKAAATEELLKAVCEILRSRLIDARTETEVAELLGVTKPQTKVWLLQLVNKGALERISKPKPVRFRTPREADRLL